MKTRWLAIAAVVAVAAWARTAQARFSPYLTSITTGAGVSDFVRSEIHENTSVAGAWDARLTVGTRTPLALEAAYVGTLQTEQDPLLATQDQARLSSSQVTGSARINIIPTRVQPFVAGGAGWVNF